MASLGPRYISVSFLFVVFLVMYGHRVSAQSESGGVGNDADQARKVEIYRQMSFGRLAELEGDKATIKGTNGWAHYAEAHTWYSKAAEQGNSPSQYGLGRLYSRGLGVSQNHAEAMKWFNKAADEGLVGAIYEVGLAHARGNGVPKNNAEAVKQFYRAAQAGLADAHFALGINYYKGEGVPKNYVLSHMWFNLAAAMTPPRADAAGLREKLEAMMTADQIATAQSLGQRCFVSNYQDCSFPASGQEIRRKIP